MIPLPFQPKIIKVKENVGVFEIAGLYPGYGVTIGNSLRRVLLSSLEGAAITQFQIKGVPHEFSTIPGVLEDVISIILNLKKVRLRLHGSEPQRATLVSRGEGKVLASHFKFPSQVELVNPEALIATLTDKKASLEMEVRVEKGVGYEPVEERKRGKAEIGAIPIDAIYTPIQRVSFRVENMRVGERTDFDRLILEIETDGSVLPEEAFVKSCQILVDHFSFLVRLAIKDRVKPSSLPEQVLALKKLADLGLSERVLRILAEHKITTLNSLLRKTGKDLLAQRGMGEKTIAEIEERLKAFNLALKE